MTIDDTAAGLLAQIIPALLVFLALEDRLSPARIKNGDWRKRLMRMREKAVVLNLIALAMCLGVVITKEESLVLTIVITASVAFLLLTLILLFAGMFGREDEPSEQAAEVTI